MVWALGAASLAALTGCPEAPDSYYEQLDASEASCVPGGEGGVLPESSGSADASDGGDGEASSSPGQGDGGDAGDAAEAGDGFVPPVTVPGAMPTIASGLGFACRVDPEGNVW